MAENAAQKEPERRPWRVEPEEIPPELADNDFVLSLTTITPDEERVFARLAELDRRDP